MAYLTHYKDLQSNALNNFLTYSSIHCVEPENVENFYNWYFGIGFLYEYDDEYRYKLLNDLTTVIRCESQNYSDYDYDCLHQQLNYYKLELLSLDNYLNAHRTEDYESYLRTEIITESLNELVTTYQQFTEEIMAIGGYFPIRFNGYCIYNPFVEYYETNNENIENIDNVGDNEDDEDDEDNEDTIMNSLLEQMIWNDMLKEDEILREMTKEEREQEERELEKLGDVEYDPMTICVVCMVRKQNIKIFPCGHTETCIKCVGKIIPDLNGNKLCPVCREIIEHYQQIT